MEPYYNSSYGTGFEGILNYTNELVNGWFITAFLAFVWIASLFVMSKGEWKMSSSVGFASLLCFILAMIFKLFLDVSNLVLYIFIILIAISIAWSIMDRSN